MTVPFGARGPFGLVLRRALVVATLPTAAATGLALLLPLLFAAEGAAAVDGAGAAASGWLSLPLLVAALATALTAVGFWPRFARDRPGADWVRHHQPGRLGGNGAALLGALAAQWLLSLPLLLVLPGWLGAPAQAHAHVNLAAPAPALLDADRAPLRLSPPPDRRWDRLLLRPLAGMPRGPLQPTQVAVLVDGHERPDRTAFTESRQLAAVPLPDQPIAALELRCLGGTVPLFFGPDSLVLVEREPRPRWWNSLWLALVALLPSFVGLSLAVLVGTAAALPTVLTLVASTVFLLTLGDVGPFGPAVRMLLRGQWLPAGAVFPMCAPLLAVGSLAMAAVLVLRPRWMR
ncbi:MAG: hypothetical protein MUC36_15070 [Planctomycetes bacterium]|nr:hypothetical protein [Planctomycetota bacterium]